MEVVVTEYSSNRQSEQDITNGQLCQLGFIPSLLLHIFPYTKSAYEYEYNYNVWGIFANIFPMAAALLSQCVNILKCIHIPCLLKTHSELVSALQE